MDGERMDLGFGRMTNLTHIYREMEGEREREREREIER